MIDRITRNLQTLKGFRVKFTTTPTVNDNDGEEGELRVNKHQGVSKLYIKIDNKWRQIPLGD